MNGEVKEISKYYYILHDHCYTCKYYSDKRCERLGIEPLETFICDFFKRKNSGAFRRKRRKVKKVYDSENMG